MSITKACKELGYSKQAYFKSVKLQILKEQQEQKASVTILREVKKYRKEMPKIGALKLYYLIAPLLQKKGFKIGRDKFASILKEHNYLVIRKKKYYRTTDSRNWQNQYDNLIEDVIPNRPEQIWVSDITYILTKTKQVLYGHLVTDAYSKKIMGYEVAIDMKASSSVKALQMAIDNRQYSEQLIHHSDRGSQYCSALYTDLLKENDILISTTQNGSPYDNPIAERMNDIVKNEFELDENARNVEDAKKKLAKLVDTYNNLRPHRSNHMLTPQQMHNQNKLPIITWGKTKVLEEE